jgi:hypothetical protein
LEGYYLRRDHENETLRIVAWCSANSGRIEAKKLTDIFTIQSIDNIGEQIDYVAVMMDRIAKDKEALSAALEN